MPGQTPLPASPLTEIPRRIGALLDALVQFPEEHRLALRYLRSRDGTEQALVDAVGSLERATQSLASGRLVPLVVVSEPSSRIAATAPRMPAVARLASGHTRTAQSG